MMPTHCSSATVPRHIGSEAPATEYHAAATPSSNRPTAFPPNISARRFRPHKWRMTTDSQITVVNPGSARPWRRLSCGMDDPGTDGGPIERHNRNGSNQLDHPHRPWPSVLRLGQGTTDGRSGATARRPRERGAIPRHRSPLRLSLRSRSQWVELRRPKCLQTPRRSITPMLSYGCHSRDGAGLASASLSKLAAGYGPSPPALPVTAMARRFLYRHGP